MHEGTDTVKQSKLQKLYTAFETIKMEDDETFDEFNLKLNAIANDTFTLGEPIPKNRILKKTLRSLPERFDAKVVAIKENKNLNALKVDELVGNLQTFEANLRSNGKTQSKGIALKASKESYKIVASDSDSNSEEIDPQVVVQFMKQFKLFMKGKKTNVTILKNSRKKKLLQEFNAISVKAMGTLLMTMETKNLKRRL